MKEMIDLLGKILTNILTAFYEPFGFSLLLSFFAMFFYLYAYKAQDAGKGWKNATVSNFIIANCMASWCVHGNCRPVIFSIG